MKTKDWIMIILSLVVVFLIYLNRRNKAEFDKGRQLVNVDTIEVKVSTADTVIKWLPVRSVPQVQLVRFYDTVYIDSAMKVVDTLGVISDYFAKRFYRDTIMIDSTYLVIIHDTVFRNRLAGRNIGYKKLYDTHLLVNRDFVVKERKVYLGGLVGRSRDEFGLGVSTTFLDKKDRAYHLGYDVIQQDLYLGMSFRIW